MSAGTTSYRRRGRLALERLDLDRLALPALLLAVITSGLLLLHLTRGTSFWADDWIWIATRRANTVDAFLAPYNGHLSLVPIAIYRLMFAVFGLSSYTPYRALVIALSLAVAVLVFAYARTRTGDVIAVAAAASMLFLGPGWQDMMWAFQISWLIVAAAGIVALMLVERRTTPADAGACAVILLAVCSTSLGLAFAVGIAVDLALARRRWRDSWIVGVPLALYAIWSLHYHASQIDFSAITTVPLSIAKAAAAAPSTLAGLSGSRPFDETGLSLTYGWPLLAIAGGLALLRARTARPTARAASLAVVFVVFATSVSIVHGELANPLTSRYIYVYCVLAVLLAAELARGVRPRRPVQLALTAVVLAAIVANVGSLRAFGDYIRTSGATTNGALTALDLDRDHVDPNTVARISLYQFIRLPARSYFDAQRALGTPAYTIAQLRRADVNAQSAADAQLLADGDVRLRPAGARTTARAVAPLDAAASTNGTVSRAGACLRFTPAAALTPGGIAAVSLIVAPGALSVTSAGAPTTLSVRRFAATFTSLGTVAARASATVTIRRDAATEPWYLQLSSVAPVRACQVPG